MLGGFDGKSEVKPERFSFVMFGSVGEGATLGYVVMDGVCDGELLMTRWHWNCCDHLEIASSDAINVIPRATSIGSQN